MTKTKVRITDTFNQSKFKRGDIGYIDGYITNSCYPSNNQILAIVIVKTKIHPVPIESLEVLDEQ